MNSIITFHAPHLATVKSFTSDAKYEVNLEKGSCSCMDWTMRGYKKKDYQCKHIKEVKKILGQG